MTRETRRFEATTTTCDRCLAPVEAAQARPVADRVAEGTVAQACSTRCFKQLEAHEALF